MKVPIVILGTIAVLILGFFVYSGYISQEEAPDTEIAGLPAQFQERIIARGIERLDAHPIEGFDAGLLMGAFPGLVASDFDGVAAFEGVYRVEEGEAVFVRTQSEPVSSAESTVSSEGYVTLLARTSTRLSLPVRTHADIETLIDALAAGEPQTAGESFEPVRLTLEGEVVCLPHTDTSGPQTMECAYGLKEDDGTYYALDFALMSQYPPNVDTGTRVRASGVFTPLERLSTDHWKIYPIVGIFSVTDSVIAL